MTAPDSQQEQLAAALWSAFEENILGEETDMRREWDEIPAVTRTAWRAVAAAAARLIHHHCPALNCQACYRTEPPQFTPMPACAGCGQPITPGGTWTGTAYAGWEHYATRRQACTTPGGQPLTRDDGTWQAARPANTSQE